MQFYFDIKQIGVFSNICFVSLIKIKIVLKK